MRTFVISLYRDLWMRRSFHADRPQPSGHGDGMRKLRLYGVGALWAALAGAFATWWWHDLHGCHGTFSVWASTPLTHYVCIGCSTHDVLLIFDCAAYALLLAPNQTPDNDGMLLKALVGFEDPGDWFVPNPVFAALFNAMGVLPAIYACLIIPGGRSGNKVG